MPKESHITAGLVEAMLNKGMNQTQVADELGVTKQRISNVLRSSSIHELSQRQKANEAFPWKPGKYYNKSQSDRKLRDHAEYMVSGGRDMSRDKLYRLQGFYRKLEQENLVVEFHPDIPPTKGNPMGGYAYRERKDSDGDLIIRVNELARLTPENIDIWRWPPKYPELPEDK